MTDGRYRPPQWRLNALRSPSSIDVRVGHSVKAATPGKLGSTGRSTGPHLHYETRLKCEAVDPQKFLRAGT
jgi:murein DD-endopeptidase MepM/ murein hydrolase activator NlpD